MNSIDQQQPEDNLKHLNGKEAVEKMKALTDKAKTCFFCTAGEGGALVNVRPMSVQKLDDEGNFWFLSPKDSNKNFETQKDHTVQLLFQGSAHSDFLSVYGQATISYDKEKIKELWEPMVKTWFTEGVDDPRISVIKVTPTEGYYWDTKHGNIVAFAKIMIGAAIGKTLDDSIQGELHT